MAGKHGKQPVSSHLEVETGSRESKLGMAGDSETSEPTPSSDVFPPTRLHRLSLPKSYQREIKCSNAWRSWRTVFIQTTAIIIYVIHRSAALCSVRSIIIFIYMYSVYVLPRCRCLQRSDRGIQFLGAGVRGGCELPYAGSGNLEIRLTPSTTASNAFDSSITSSVQLATSYFFKK